ncbi:MAG: CDP-alcohol phosphatidyltransferase family protein [Pyrinomonadaceae bacterium]
MESNVLTIPNVLTVLRMALIPVFAILLYYGYSVWALIIFLTAGASDAFDGFIARKFQQQSNLGTVIDPIADKLLMITSFVVLSLPHIFPPSPHLPVPFWVTASVIGRDVLIISVATAIVVMTGFRDFKPSPLGKLSTVAQVLAVVLILVAVIFPKFGGVYLPTVYTTVVVLAFLSGVHYIFFVAKLMREAEKEETV